MCTQCAVVLGEFSFLSSSTDAAMYIIMYCLIIISNSGEGMPKDIFPISVFFFLLYHHAVYTEPKIRT